MATTAYRFPFSGDCQNSPRRLPAVALCLCLMLLLPLCASAQNNPYKIDDSLYALYQKAYQRRAYPDGLKMAGEMLREAERLGDGKAQCLALSVVMFYYYYKDPGDEPGFRRAVKAMQDRAVATGFRQYYYFGMTNTVNWLLLRKRMNEAMQYVAKFVEIARKDNDMLGLYNGLNSLAQVHIARMEYGVAIKTLKEALETGQKYLPGQDLSQTRFKLTDCYSSRFDYTNLYATAQNGFREARTKKFRLKFLTEMMFAAMKLGQTDKARECYDEYVKINGPVKETSEEICDIRTLVMKCILDGDYVRAQELLDVFPNGYGRYLIRLSMLRSEAKGDMKALAEQKTFFYRRWIELKDEVMSQNMAELSASFFNQKLDMENGLLTLERQRMANERQRAEIDLSNLQIANTELSLRNSSLELGRTKAQADLLRLAADKKRLETARLKTRVSEEHARRTTAELRIWTVIAVILVLIVAAIHVLAIHRRTTRRLAGLHKQLASNNVEFAEARNRAVAADNVKTALIQNMTRDVNIPLNAITGFAQLIADRKATYSPEERAEYFRQIHDNTDRMLAIVRDVLEKAQK